MPACKGLFMNALYVRHEMKLFGIGQQVYV